MSVSISKRAWDKQFADPSEPPDARAARVPMRPRAVAAGLLALAATAGAYVVFPAGLPARPAPERAQRTAAPRVSYAPPPGVRNQSTPALWKSLRSERPRPTRSPHKEAP